MTFLFIAILALNVFIAYWNARECGKVWAETKVIGGWPHVLVWCGVIQSVIGFSMFYLVVGAFGLAALGFLDGAAVKAMLSLWYLFAIIPALGTGTIIMVESWIVAWRERSFLNMGVAAYNTLANVHNVYSAFNGGISEAFSSVGEFLSDSDDIRGLFAKIAIVIFVLLTIGLGALTTRYVMTKHAGTLPIPSKEPAHA